MDILKSILEQAVENKVKQTVEETLKKNDIDPKKAEELVEDIKNLKK